MQDIFVATRADDLEARFRDFVSAPDFPCVGAKSALARGTLKVIAGRDIRSAWNDLKIHDALLDWAYEYQREPEGLRSLAVASSMRPIQAPR